MGHRQDDTKPRVDARGRRFKIIDESDAWDGPTRADAYVDRWDAAGCDVLEPVVYPVRKSDGPDGDQMTYAILGPGFALTFVIRDAVRQAWVRASLYQAERSGAFANPWPRRPHTPQMLRAIFCALLLDLHASTSVLAPVQNPSSSGEPL